MIASSFMLVSPGQAAEMDFPIVRIRAAKSMFESHAVNASFSCVINSFNI